MSAPCPEFGFVVRVDSGGKTSPAELRSMLAEAIHGTGLELRAFSGGPRAFVVTREGSQATETDRQLIIERLERRLHSTGVLVSDLIDLAAHD